MARTLNMARFDPYICGGSRVTVDALYFRMGIGCHFMEGKGFCEMGASTSESLTPPMLVATDVQRGTLLERTLKTSTWFHNR